MSPLKGLIFSHLMFARLEFLLAAPLQSVRRDPPTEFSDWPAMRNHNVTEKNGSITWGEKRLGFLKRGSWTSDILATNNRIANEFNFLQHNRNMCSHYSVKSHVSVSLVPGKISLGVISMDGVKAFEKIAMDLQLLHNQIKHIGIWRLLVKDLIG